MLGQPQSITDHSEWIRELKASGNTGNARVYVGKFVSYNYLHLSFEYNSIGSALCPEVLVYLYQWPIEYLTYKQFTTPANCFLADRIRLNTTVVNPIIDLDGQVQQWVAGLSVGNLRFMERIKTALHNYYKLYK
jgi:hypothetical protein